MICPTLSALYLYSPIVPIGWSLTKRNAWARRSAITNVALDHVTARCQRRMVLPTFADSIFALSNKERALHTFAILCPNSTFVTSYNHSTRPRSPGGDSHSPT